MSSRTGWILFVLLYVLFIFPAMTALLVWRMGVFRDFLADFRAGQRARLVALVGMLILTAILVIGTRVWPI